MPKEIIQISDISNTEWPDDLEGYKLVKETKGSFDGEKGSISIECIFKRKCDNKYFKVYYTDWGRGQSDFNEQSLIEVVKKQKTIVVDYYE